LEALWPTINPLLVLTLSAEDSAKYGREKSTVIVRKVEVFILRRFGGTQIWQPHKKTAKKKVVRITACLRGSADLTASEIRLYPKRILAFLICTTCRLSDVR
jgi:hypothetical protein